MSEYATAADLTSLATLVTKLQKQYEKHDLELSVYRPIVAPIYKSHLVKGVTCSIFWRQQHLFGNRHIKPSIVTLLDNLLGKITGVGQWAASLEALRIYQAAFGTGVEVPLTGNDGKLLAEAKAGPPTPSLPHFLKSNYYPPMTSVSSDILQRISNDVSLCAFPCSPKFMLDMAVRPTRLGPQRRGSCNDAIATQQIYILARRGGEGVLC
jgi:hypothetical protein